MVWIPMVVLGGIILTLLIAPVLEAKLSKRVIQPVLVAAALATVGLILAISGAYANDDDAHRVLGILSGIVSSIALFFVVVACARFAMKDEKPPVE